MVKRTPIALLVSAIALSTGPISGAHAISCNAGPYIIFFDEGEAYVDKSGQDVLDNVSESAANCGYGLTFIAGHSDGFENASVAMKRARTVRAYLVAHGIPDDDIEMQSLVIQKDRHVDVLDEEYRMGLLGSGIRVAVEAAVAQGWEKYLGENGGFVGMTGFGASAPADRLYQHFGITPEAVAATVMDLL